MKSPKVSDPDFLYLSVSKQYQKAPGAMSQLQSTSQRRLSQQISHAVVHNPHLNHRLLHIKTKNGRVVLEGTVRTYFEKQMAQEALRKIDGILLIENQLEVSW